MSYQKLNPNRAWTVTPSDFAPLPVFMEVSLSNTPLDNTYTSSDNWFVVKPPAGFPQPPDLSKLLRTGDVIYGNTSGVSTTVTDVAITSFGYSVNFTGGGNDFDSLGSGIEPISIFRGNNRGGLLYVGIAGDVRVLTAGNDDVTFKGVAAGAFIPVNVIQVFATGTTAEEILALY
jgi:hypothetical protein